MNPLMYPAATTAFTNHRRSVHAWVFDLAVEWDRMGKNIRSC